jgi:hypothetical protein
MDRFLVVAVAARVTQATIPCNNEQQNNLSPLVTKVEGLTMRGKPTDNVPRVFDHCLETHSIVKLPTTTLR